MALVNVIHIELPCPLHGGGGIPAADHTSSYAMILQPAQRQTILRIEALGFHHFSRCIGKMIDVAIGQNPIHIHEQQLDFRRARANFRARRLWHWFSSNSCSRDCLGVNR